MPDYPLTISVQDALGQSAALPPFVLNVQAAGAGPPVYSVQGNVTQAEGNAGSTNFVFTVSRSGDISAVGSVSYAVLGTGPNPAVAADFIGDVFPSGTVNFAAGQASKTVSIPVKGELAIEPNETFQLTISSVVGGGSIGTASRTGNITNDDVVGSDAISAVSSEGWFATANSPANEYDPEGPTPVSFIVNRQGYDTAGGLQSFPVEVYLTHRMRYRPYQFGNANDFATRDPAGYASLSHWLFTTDSVPGISSWSTRTPPKPLGAILVPDRAVFGATADLRWAAFAHGARGQRTAPRLEFRIRETATPANSTGWLAATWTDQFTDGVDRNCVSGFEALNMSLAQFPEATDLTVDWRIYPAVGNAAAIRSTEDASRPAAINPIVIRKYTNPQILYVASTGNDNTGNGSSGAPYATVVKAMNIMGAAGRNGGRIRIKDSGALWGAVGAYPPEGALNAFLTVEKDPATAGTVTLTLPAGNTYSECKYLRFKDLTVVRGGNVFFYTLTDGTQWFDNCILNNLSNSLFWVGNSYNVNFVFTGTEIVNFVEGVFNQQANMFCYLSRGLKILTPAGSNHGFGMYVMVGCHFRGVHMFDNSSGRDYSGSILAFNRFLGMGGNVGTVDYPQPNNVTLDGYVQVANEFEWSGATVTPNLGISRDPPVLFGTTNGILWNNSYIGSKGAGRCNFWYDDNHPGSGSETVVRQQTVLDVRGNCFSQINIKGGQFVGLDLGYAANAALHVGNLGVIHGVGFIGNALLFIDEKGGTANRTPNNTFSQLYVGVDCYVGGVTLSANLPGIWADPKCVTNTGPNTYVAGAGDGDYRVKDVNSPLYQRLAEAVLPRTLGGAVRPALNDCAGPRTLAA